ncbi:hypothetical protein LTR60_004745, partial [Cryomyces antarcticus]
MAKASRDMASRSDGRHGSSSRRESRQRHGATNEEHAVPEAQKPDTEQLRQVRASFYSKSPEERRREQMVHETRVTASGSEGSKKMFSKSGEKMAEKERGEHKHKRRQEGRNKTRRYRDDAGYVYSRPQNVNPSGTGVSPEAGGGDASSEEAKVLDRPGKSRIDSKSKTRSKTSKRSEATTARVEQPVLSVAEHTSRGVGRDSVDIKPSLRRVHTRYFSAQLHALNSAAISDKEQTFNSSSHFLFRHGTRSREADRCIHITLEEHARAPIKSTVFNLSFHSGSA